jgi:hypothetical protein
MATGVFIWFRGFFGPWCEVFTYTKWGHHRLRAEEWREEIEFMLRYLPHSWKVCQDVHITGEFVQVGPGW